MTLNKLIEVLQTHQASIGETEVQIQTGEYGVVAPLVIQDVDFGQDANGVHFVIIEAVDPRYLNTWEK